METSDSFEDSNAKNSCKNSDNDSMTAIETFNNLFKLSEFASSVNDFHLLMSLWTSMLVLAKKYIKECNFSKPQETTSKIPAKIMSHYCTSATLQLALIYKKIDMKKFFNICTFIITIAKFYLSHLNKVVLEFTPYLLNPPCFKSLFETLAAIRYFFNDEAALESITISKNISTVVSCLFQSRLLTLDARLDVFHLLASKFSTSLSQLVSDIDDGDRYTINESERLWFMCILLRFIEQETSQQETVILKAISQFLNQIDNKDPVSFCGYQDNISSCFDDAILGLLSVSHSLDTSTWPKLDIIMYTMFLKSVNPHIHLFIIEFYCYIGNVQIIFSL